MACIHRHMAEDIVLLSVVNQVKTVKRFRRAAVAISKDILLRRIHPGHCICITPIHYHLFCKSLVNARHSCRICRIWGMT